MLYEALKYYCRELEKPGYAVMVTGDWGVGKTHQVKAALAKIEAEWPHRDANLNYKSAYVSLYGLASAAEIDAAVVRSFSPAAANSIAGFKLFASAASEFVGLSSIAGAMLETERAAIELQLKQAANKTIVFDDLERSSLDHKILMGVINAYVEHLGYRVILICHDDKLDVLYNEGKEKIIGQSIKALPQTTNAWTAFLSELPNETGRAFVKQHQDLLLKVFEQTGVNSLRILRHVMFDCARFGEAMTADQRDNDYGCAKIIAWFAAMNAFVRHGDIKETDYADILSGKYYWRRALQPNSKQGELTQNEQRIYTLNDCVPSVNLTTPPLTAKDGSSDYSAEMDVQRAMIFDGHCDASKIQSVLADASQFKKPADRKPWQKLWHAHEHTDQEMAASLVELDDQLARHEITDFVDLMHIAAIQMSFIKDGIISAETLAGCEADFISYVAAIKTSGTIDEKYGDRQNVPDVTHGLGGLGLTDRDDPEILLRVKNIADAYWQASCQKWLSLSRAEISKLPDWIKGDGAQISQLYDNALFKQPLHIFEDAQPVADALLAAPPKNWVLFSRYQSGRYKNNGTNVFENEKEFLAELCRLLEIERTRLLGTTALDARFKANRIDGFLRRELFKPFRRFNPPETI